jgi:predicted metalloendopeptidase
MLIFRTTPLVVIFAFAVSLGTAAAPVDQNVKAQDVDRSVRPGDDFYRYANGGWLKNGSDT